MFFGIMSLVAVVACLITLCIAAKFDKDDDNKLYGLVFGLFLLGFALQYIILANIVTLSNEVKDIKMLIQKEEPKE